MLKAFHDLRKSVRLTPLRLAACHKKWDGILPCRVGSAVLTVENAAATLIFASDPSVMSFCSSWTFTGLQRLQKCRHLF